MKLSNDDINEYEHIFCRIMKVGNNLKINRMVHTVDKKTSGRSKCEKYSENYSRR